MRPHQDEIVARITELRTAGWTQPEAQQQAWQEYQRRGRRASLVEIVRTADVCAAIRRRA